MSVMLLAFLLGVDLDVKLLGSHNDAGDFIVFGRSVPPLCDLLRNQWPPVLYGSMSFALIF